MPNFDQRSPWAIIKGIWIRSLSILTNFTFPYFVTVACHKMRGVKIGKQTHICRGAYLDDHSPQLIEIGNGVGITEGVVIICHQRDLSNYHPGMYAIDCPFKLGKVVIKDGDKVVIIDDLMATGGTFKAVQNIVERMGGEVVGFINLIELTDLKGRDVFENNK